MTAEIRKGDLQAIRDFVAWRFSYTSDQEARGVPEHWVDVDELAGLSEFSTLTYGKFRDDCDGFALACRYQLRKVDIPNRLIFCHVPVEGYHLVLSVGGYILDNRSKWVIPRDDVDYAWVSMSGYTKGDPWHLIEED